MMLSHLRLVYVRRIPGPAASIVHRLFLGESCSRVRDYLLVASGGHSGFAGVDVDVACAATARAVCAVTLVADGAFAHDLAIGVGGIVGLDVGGACGRFVSVTITVLSR